MIFLFYITVSYHQTNLNSIQVIEWTLKCLGTDVQLDGQMTDGHQAHRYILKPSMSVGIKMFALTTARKLYRLKSSLPR